MLPWQTINILIIIQIPPKMLYIAPFFRNFSGILESTFAGAHLVMEHQSTAKRGKLISSIAVKMQQQLGDYYTSNYDCERSRSQSAYWKRTNKI